MTRSKRYDFIFSINYHIHKILFLYLLWNLLHNCKTYCSFFPPLSLKMSIFFKVKTVCFSFTTFLTLWRYFFCEIIWINWVVTAYVHSWWRQTMKKKHTTSNNLHNFDSRRDEMNNCEVDVDDVEEELTTQRNSRKKRLIKMLKIKSTTRCKYSEPERNKICQLCKW